MNGSTERMRDKMVGGEGFVCYPLDKSIQDEVFILQRKLRGTQEMLSKIVVERNILREAVAEAIANLNGILSTMINKGSAKLILERVAETIDILRLKSH